MSDELLPYYEKELTFIRRSGAEFSQAHPKIASRLRISAETVEDPHVSRLLESFAYLNARIQHKLDDDFPELTDALFSVLYPHYQRPIPSCSIVQFTPGSDLDCRFDVDENTLLETPPFQGETCKFRTRYPVSLWPFKVQEAALIARPFVAPGANQMKGAGGILKLAMKSFTEGMNLSELKIEKLRFFLQGQPQYTYPLHELILNKNMKVVLARGEDDIEPIYISSECIKPVGFGTEEGLLPYPSTSFQGYRLLTEFFLFPEKFLFFDIDGLDKYIPEEWEDEFHLYIYLEQSNSELERQIDHTAFALNCTPVINLFEQQAEPIRLDHTQSEYQIIPDARRRRSLEVYSIDEVKATNSDGAQTEYLPFYGIKHSYQDQNIDTFWHAQRVDASIADSPDREGTEVYLSFTDLNFQPSAIDDQTVSIKTHCLNRNLPSKLPFGGGQPSLFAVDSSPPVSNIHCLTPPTPTVRPPLRERGRWRLMSHLNLNHLSLSNSAIATDALKEILKLYDFTDSASIRASIEAISSVKTEPATAPITVEGYTVMCRGTQVHIELDETLLTGSSPFIFASILERFFALYCTINSFTRTLVSIKGKEGYLKKWPPRAGEKLLV